MSLLWAGYRTAKATTYTNAEIHYELAAQYPLRTANDHVAALVHVANISIRQGQL